MTADAAFLQGVEAVLVEAERHAAWTAELEDEVRAARQRRAQLMDSLDCLLRALGPEAARFTPRLAAITDPAPPRPVGNLAPDGRLAALKRLLAEWPDETITPLAATRALAEQGLKIPKNYAFNRFTGMEKRGVLVRVETGRYRIVRTHPDVVALGATRLTAERPAQAS
jgi:hypothetical protein